MCSVWQRCITRSFDLPTELSCLFFPTALHWYFYRVHAVSLTRSKCQWHYFGMSMLTTAFHRSASRTKGVLFLSLPTNHTGLPTVRLFKLDIPVRTDAGGCAFEGLQLYQFFHMRGRSRTESRNDFT
jgi:hypothetical protein